MKRTVEESFFGPGDPAVLYEFPELEGEMPALFAVMGEARVVDRWLMGVVVEIELMEPAYVVKYNSVGGRPKGQSINPSTNACTNLVHVDSIPRTGDTKVRLLINLEATYADPDHNVSLDWFRKRFSDTAAEMAQGWYYYAN